MKEKVFPKTKLYITIILNDFLVTSKSKCFKTKCEEGEWFTDWNSCVSRFDEYFLVVLQYDFTMCSGGLLVLLLVLLAFGFIAIFVHNQVRKRFNVRWNLFFYIWLNHFRIGHVLPLKKYVAFTKGILLTYLDVVVCGKLWLKG